MRGGEPATEVNGSSESEDTPDRFKPAMGEVGVTGTPDCRGVLSYLVVVIAGGAPGRRALRLVVELPPMALPRGVTATGVGASGVSISLSLLRASLRAFTQSSHSFWLDA